MNYICSAFLSAEGHVGGLPDKEAAIKRSGRAERSEVKRKMPCSDVPEAMHSDRGIAAGTLSNQMWPISDKYWLIYGLLPLV